MLEKVSYLGCMIALLFDICIPVCSDKVLHIKNNK